MERPVGELLGGRLLDFPKGLRWSCARCGMCCRDTPYHRRRVLLLRREAREIAEAAGLGVGEFACEEPGKGLYPLRMKMKEGSCVFLEDGRCRIYAHRPLTCRFYPFGLVEREGRYAFVLTGEPCRGLGRGDELREAFFENLLADALGGAGPLSGGASPSCLRGARRGRRR